MIIDPKKYRRTFPPFRIYADISLILQNLYAADGEVEILDNVFSISGGQQTVTQEEGGVSVNSWVNETNVKMYECITNVQTSSVGLHVMSGFVINFSHIRHPSCTLELMYLTRLTYAINILFTNQKVNKIVTMYSHVQELKTGSDHEKYLYVIQKHSMV